MNDIKILIVDDDHAMRDLLKMQITSFGLSHMTAVDGLEAVEKLQQDDFTIVLTDMMMPNMNGMQLLNHIRENYPDIEVVVITGYGDTFSYTDVIEAGASDFLKKPYRANELEAKLNRVIREQRLISELKAMAETLERQLKERTRSLEEVNTDLNESLDRVKQLQAQMIITKYGKPRLSSNPYNIKKKTPDSEKEE